MAKQLPSPAEQLERLIDGLDRLARFDMLAFDPRQNAKTKRTLILVDIEIERLEKQIHEEG